MFTEVKTHLGTFFVFDLEGVGYNNKQCIV